MNIKCYFGTLILLIVTLILAIYFTIYRSTTYDYKNGILNNKFTKCYYTNLNDSNDSVDDTQTSIDDINNIIRYDCDVVFNMYIANQSYCIIKKQNSTYDDYDIGNTYKIHLTDQTDQIDQIDQTNICKFGSEKNTNIKMYAVGTGMFVQFVVIIICCNAYIKSKIEERQHEIIDTVAQIKSTEFIAIPVQTASNYLCVENCDIDTIHDAYAV
jgi:hypothetical protein